MSSSEPIVPTSPDVSVVIPTFNRCDRLMRVLRALDLQSLTTPHGRPFTFEVVVVSDGSTDGTGDAVRGFAASFPVNLVEQANAGPGAARNAGIETSTGNVVVFIDDDVMPEVGCLGEHVMQHDLQRDLVVIGPMLTPTDSQLSPWVEWEQHQLEKQYAWFATNSSAGHMHFYTGNASVERRVLLAVGGFDTEFKRAEDIELASRLAGFRQSFIVDVDARAHHYAERSYDSWLQTAYDYGYNHVRFARMGRDEYWQRIPDDFDDLHPALRTVIMVVFPHRRLTTFVQRSARRLALLADSVGVRAVSRPMLSLVYGLAHVRGSADALGSATAFKDLVRHGTRPTDDLVALFLLEQTLGHVTHSKNLQALLPDVDALVPMFAEVDASTGLLGRIPGLSNWTVRAGLRARRQLRRLRSSDEHRIDAMFVHTQVPAVLLGRWMKRVPTVVSVDATPAQYDSLGEFYAHHPGPPRIEQLKKSANVRCFARARHIVTWSQWAKDGLVDAYDVSPGKISVIAPGVDLDRWTRSFSPDRAAPDRPLRVLFVGGNLQRKGGDLLMEAARLLRDDEHVPAFELHLVTGSELDSEPGVVVHHGLTSNSPELIAQYHSADIFCLPTLGDCLPMVLAEAAAAGLPLISTDVGAIRELVQDGRTGRLIRPGNLDELVDALRSMLLSPDERSRFAHEARRLVEQHHDATTNARRIVSILREVAVPRQATI